MIHLHSGLRWIVLLLLVYVVINAVVKKTSGTYGKGDKLVGLFSMIGLHVQFLVGLSLYFTSSRVQFTEGWMKVASLRFYGMEHFIGMLLAIVLITIGYSKAKRQENPNAKHATTLTYYAIGLILIIAFIPWPFRSGLGGNWF